MKINNNDDFDKFWGIEKKIDELAEILEWECEGILPDSLLSNLNDLSETIYKKRREYQQKKYNALKTA